jgi:teichuronic acid exporter
MTQPANLGPAADGEARAALDRVFVRGFAWTGMVKWLSQSFSWAATLVVVRLLAPEDYGVVGVAGVVLSLLGMLAEFGMGWAIVLRADLDARAHRELHTTATLLGFATAAACLPLGIPMAGFFHMEELRLAFPVMGLGFFISGVRTVPWALLNKRLQFRTLALIDASQIGVASVLSVALALLGWRYWALIIPNLLGALVAAVWAHACVPVSFGSPRRSTVERVGGISGHLMVQRLAWFAYNTADSVIIGRVLGQEPLGLYTLGGTLANTASEKANELVGRVTTGVFPAARESVGELRRYLLLTIEFLALLIFPIGFLLGFEAEWVATVVLGPKWAPMAATLRILSFAVVVRCLAPPVDRALFTMGRQRFVSGMSAILTLSLIGGFALASRWGIEGVALVWLTVYPFVVLPSFVWAVRVLEISGRDLRRALGRAAVMTALSAAVLALCERAVCAFGVSASAAAPIALILGVATYAGLGAWLIRPRLGRLLQHLRGDSPTGMTASGS